MKISRIARPQFPALERQVAGRPAAFLDGPAGSQAPRRVIDAVADYLRKSSANSGGSFLTSQETGAMLRRAREALGDFLGVREAESIVFGPNMTTLTFSLSRALARTWSEGDEVLVTDLDHDANFTPWVLAARDAGATLRQVAITADGRLDLEDLERQLGPKTRLLAVTGASNALGTLTPIAEIVERVHSVGAEVYLDAVHLAPHRALSVDAWGVDYAVCSAYKFFGPHIGVLWGRRARLEELPAYQVRPAEGSVPSRWMTGTQSHEGIAGALQAVEYLADLGRTITADLSLTRRAALEAAYAAISSEEEALVGELLEGLLSLPGLRVHGIAEPTAGERVGTVSFRHETIPADELSARLGERGIFTWSGNFYAQPVTEALGLEPAGLVRVGLLHYNDRSDVDHLLESLRAIV